jgi:hypothetical protein
LCVVPFFRSVVKFRLRNHFYTSLALSNICGLTVKLLCHLSRSFWTRSTRRSFQRHFAINVSLLIIMYAYSYLGCHLPFRAVNRGLLRVILRCRDRALSKVTLYERVRLPARPGNSFLLQLVSTGGATFSTMCLPVAAITHRGSSHLYLTASILIKILLFPSR